VCPINAHCEARRLGIQRELPTKKEKAKPIELQAEAWVIIHGEDLLLARRAAGSWLSGMWDLPWWVDGREAAPTPPENSAQFARCAEKRTITKHKIQFLVTGYQCEAKPDPVALKVPGSEFRWVALADFHGVNLPRPSERALEKLLAKREKMEG
jgi:adenine-specific DNA glycosylase